MRLKIWHKGILLVSVPLVFQLGFVSSLLSSQHQLEQLADQEHRDSLTSDLVEEASRSFIEAATMLIKYRQMATPPAELQAEFDNKLQTARNDVDQLLENTKGDLTLEPHALLVSQHARRTIDLLGQLERAKTTIGSMVSSAYWYKELKGSYSDLNKSIDELRVVMKERKARNPLAEAKARQQMHEAIWGGLCISMITTLALAIYFGRDIASRVLSMEQNTHRFLHKQPLLPEVGGSDEISKLDSVFHSMVESARLSEQRKQEFMAMISHDVRTPLMSLMATLNLVEMGVYGSLNETGLDRLQAAGGTVDRIVSLINELLDMERLESGSMPLNLSMVKLAAVCDASASNIRQLADKKSVELQMDCPTEITLHGDEKRLIQVLTNLLGNAVKYTPEGGTIKVSCRTDDSRAYLSVSDTGPGISDEEQKTIFDRFAQLDNAENRKIVGSGLGLAICKALVEAHGGTLTLQSKLGEGSTFTANLPYQPSTATPVEEQTCQKFL